MGELWPTVEHHELATERGIKRVPVGTWMIDPVHSSISFRIKHLGIATVRGRFTDFEGQIVAAPDYHDSRAEGTAKAASIDTDNADRDQHLRSADFFDVQNFPTIRVETTGLDHTSDGTFHVICDLTMHGVTKAVTARATVQGAEVDPWGTTAWASRSPVRSAARTSASPSTTCLTLAR